MVKTNAGMMMTKMLAVNVFCSSVNPLAMKPKILFENRMHKSPINAETMVIPQKTVLKKRVNSWGLLFWIFTTLGKNTIPMEPVKIAAK